MASQCSQNMQASKPLGAEPVLKDVSGCQNYDPFLGHPKYEVPYYNRDPKRDHNFDNHPYCEFCKPQPQPCCSGSLHGCLNNI